jgi:hypothetical protein
VGTVGQALADAKGLALEEVALATARNARALFGLGSAA